MDYLRKRKRKLKEHLSRLLKLSVEKQLFCAAYQDYYPTPEAFALVLGNPFPLESPTDVNDNEAVLQRLDCFTGNHVYFLGNKALLGLWEARRHLYHCSATKERKLKNLLYHSAWKWHRIIPWRPIAEALLQLYGPNCTSIIRNKIF